MTTDSVSFNDLMDADDRERPQREADRRLGAAWRRCEAALPEGHVLAELRRFDDWTVWAASTDNTTGVGRYHWSAEGPTPTAALEALAEKLEGMK